MLENNLKSKKNFTLIVLLLAFLTQQNVVQAENKQAIYHSDLVISELMPNTKQTEVDWIEVFNPTSRVIDLEGCTLTDENSDKITFNKSLLIKANSYAVIGSGSSQGVNLPAALKTLDFEYSSNEFELTTGPDQVILTCNNTLIDKVEYQSYRPGPASDSRGLQVEPNSLNSVANDNIKNWCYTGLPILSEQYLYANNKVASPGQPNPNCALISLPYMFINDQQKVLIEGIDFEQTLQIAAEELTRNYATAELTIWAIRDQIITKEIAKTISTLYFKHIDGLYDSEPFTMIDWNHGVWHFAWAIANLYRNGDDAIKAELQLAYEDAIKRPQTLDKYELAAIDNVLSHEVLMGDAHDMGHAFAQGHIVVPGNPDYVQSYQAYLDNRRSDFTISMINLMFTIKMFFSNLFA